MITLIGKYAGYAHGTIKKQGEINRENVIKNLDKDYEYAIRPDYLKEEGPDFKIETNLLSFSLRT